MRDEDYEDRILSCIEEHGWFCVNVMAEADDPGFAYTVGFTQTVGSPEFVIFGLDGDVMHSMLWRVFRQLKAGKRVFGETEWLAVLDGYTCVSRAVDKSNILREFFSSAIWFLGDPAENGLLAVHQLFWPSVTTRLLPWEEGAADVLLWAQPRLDLPGTGAAFIPTH